MESQHYSILELLSAIRNCWLYCFLISWRGYCLVFISQRLLQHVPNYKVKIKAASRTIYDQTNTKSAGSLVSLQKEWHKWSKLHLWLDNTRYYLALIDYFALREDKGRGRVLDPSWYDPYTSTMLLNIRLCALELRLLIDHETWNADNENPCAVILALARA